MAESALSKTAQGATFLILLQVASRALTFLVNQILLRFLTPQIFGVAIQLDLFSISTLYFARESIRVAVQRQTGDGDQDHGEDALSTQANKDSKTKKNAGQRLQEVVNLAWAAVFLGILLTILFEWLYLRKADAAVLGTPQIRTSLHLYALATIIEILNEPSFAIAQQQMLFGIRASSEMQATLIRCLVTCGAAIGASGLGMDIGVLPFAFGQFAYALVLNLSFLYQTASLSRQNAVSRLPRASGPKNEYVPRDLLTTAGNLYGQSLFKQMLTSGDQYLIAALTTLSSQGSYALASNYGGLLARIVFQPIEESSRSLLARLLPAKSSQAAQNDRDEDVNGTQQAVTYLTRLLHAYCVLSVLVVSLGPPLSGPLLYLLAGSKWSNTEAPLVLASYCYYIPVMALNGLLEAFVAVTATPAQIRGQSLWMIAFSLLFAATGILVLGWWDMGARGLVLANAITTAGRAAWSWSFTSRELGDRRGSLMLSRVLPNAGSVACGVAARAILESMTIRDGKLKDLIRAGSVIATCAASMCVPCSPQMRFQSLKPLQIAVGAPIRLRLLPNAESACGSAPWNWQDTIASWLSFTIERKYSHTNLFSRCDKLFYLWSDCSPSIDAHVRSPPTETPSPRKFSMRLPSSLALHARPRYPSVDLDTLRHDSSGCSPQTAPSSG